MLVRLMPCAMPPLPPVLENVDAIFATVCSSKFSRLTLLMRRKGLHNFLFMSSTGDTENRNTTLICFNIAFFSRAKREHLDMKHFFPWLLVASDSKTSDELSLVSSRSS